MNLPNKLTLTRVILIPVFVIFIMLREILPWSKYAAVLVFILASFTDFLDGRIARKYNLVTNFGKFMDPLADKLLVCSALICLVHFNMIPTWIVLLIVAREFTISGFRLVAAEQGIVLAASKTAKLKTATQMVMVVVLILDWTFMKIPGLILVYLSLALTIISLVEYLYKNWHIMKGQY